MSKRDPIEESIRESDKATEHASADELRAAFDEVCQIAITLQPGVPEHEAAVKKVEEIRARVG